MQLKFAALEPSLPVLKATHERGSGNVETLRASQPYSDHYLCHKTAVEYNKPGLSKSDSKPVNL